jgi:hypothetical protein
MAKADWVDIEESQDRRVFKDLERWNLPLNNFTEYAIHIGGRFDELLVLRRV